MRLILAHRKVVVALVIAALQTGCATLSGERATQAALDLAQKSGFAATLIEGKGFTHDVYARVQPHGDTVWVFIEGDGSPWTDGGTTVADDPTARNPLALRLASATPGSVVYLGRPCYLRARQDARCKPALWTSARYSDEVVASMNSALRAAINDSKPLVLVGYSGGGTLAVLMAQSLSRVMAVVTVAGNLDTDEWTKQHRYSPLIGRNPATEPSLPTSVMQIHLLGDKDDNVTASMTARYLARLQPEQIWRYQQFGHVCCWEQTWPSIVEKIGTALKERR